MQANRREFLERFCLGAAGILTACGGRAYGYPANETVQIGVIGCGGRARGSLLPQVLEIPGVRATAVCDVYTANREQAAQLAKGDGGDPFVTGYSEELLARKDVDAVIVGTPDHWHVPISVAACDSGKDVYCEKPLTHNLEEGKTLVEAQNKHRRIVQVGMQQRSMPQFARAREIVRSGRLGSIHKVHMSWNRNSLPVRNRPRVPGLSPKDFDWKRFLGSARDQPFDPYRAISNWRWFWDFGAGILGDLMVHWLDPVNWILDLPMPSHAVTIGDHFATAGLWETPDTIQTLMQYPESKLQIHFEGTFVNQHRKAGVTFMGTDGTLYVDRGRAVFEPEPKHAGEREEHILGSGIKGADFDVDGTLLHLANWIDCVRTRKKPAVPAEAGVLAADAAHFANLALAR
jgi:predicted dehydrogenase